MINYNKEIKTDILTATAKLVNAEIKLLMKSRLVGALFIEKLDSICNHICVLFDIICPVERKELRQEIQNYWDEMKSKTKDHLKESMRDDWIWLE